MNRLNIIGASVSFLVLLVLVGYLNWRVLGLQKEVLGCFKEQLKNVVHINTADTTS